MRLIRPFLALAAAACLPSLPADIIKNAPPLPVLKSGDWDSLKLKFDKPEKENEYHGSPIGNGYIGAKIKGGVETEIFQLNDKTWHSGGPEQQPPDPKRREAMRKTRELLAKGDVPGANQAARGMWGPEDVGWFLPLGTLSLKFDHGDKARDYARTLDLDQALSTVSYQVDGVTYTREAFASFPSRTVIIRLSASAPGKLTFTARLSQVAEMNGHYTVSVEGGNTLVMDQKAPVAMGPLGSKKQEWDAQKGMTSRTLIQVKPTGGRITASGDELRVEKADSVILVVANATSYAGPFKEPGTAGVAPKPAVARILKATVAQSYDQLFTAHLADYRALFRRLWVELNGERPDKYALGFQYARYDMIASSRVGDRPHNQQGMWSQRWRAESFGCHFLNENVEKYYSLIEPGNLADTGAPLWSWIYELSINGRKSAEIDWGFKGWLAPHYSDVWANTTIKGGNNEWSIWPMGGIWLCQSLWEHYAFSLDRGFLAKAYPLMKGACEFAIDLLVDNGKGQLVTSPSTSAENQFRLVPGGPTHAVTVSSVGDIVLIQQLFANTIAAARILGVDPDFQARLAATSAKMLPVSINDKGEINEWSNGYLQRDTGPSGHRHATHLLGVWPLAQVTERGTPKLFEATKVTLENRGPRGGFHPDKGAMWARLKEGDKALGSFDDFYTGRQLTGQWNPKYATFCEMLLFSHNQDARGAYELELLPALPSTWKSGKIDGIRGRGGYQLSIEWADGKLTKCRIDSPFGTIPPIRYNGALLNPATDSRITLNLLKSP